MSLTTYPTNARLRKLVDSLNAQVFHTHNAALRGDKGTSHQWHYTNRNLIKGKSICSWFRYISLSYDKKNPNIPYCTQGYPYNQRNYVATEGSEELSLSFYLGTKGTLLSD